MGYLEPVAEPIRPTGRGTELDAEIDDTDVFDWSAVEQRLAAGGWYWLASVRPDGAPHVMPVLAVWSESVVFVASKQTARKSRNLSADGRCVLTKDAEDAHLVVEGVAARVRDEETLRRASGAFEAVYGWPTTVSGELLDATYGAPTSGGPPYAAYAIRPTKAFALPVEGTFMSTRWRFLLTWSHDQVGRSTKFDPRLAPAGGDRPGRRGSARRGRLAGRHHPPGGRAGGRQRGADPLPLRRAGAAARGDHPAGGGGPR
ncbi:MAG: hypothetical protein GEV07_00200 [Streptosporangiales bacterium]|nr:hypothetical protein [Streptosporangiales bacterium]